MRSFVPFVCVLGALAGCEKHDLGEPCRELGSTGPSSDDPSRTVTQETVAQDARFPCEELICIATDGRPGYCSKKCRDDAACPDGFECRTIQDIGPFADEKFCAWKRCEKRRDCGNNDDLCCSEVTGAEPGTTLKLCGFSNDGKCE